MNVTVFAGTERRDLIDGICEVLGVALGSPLRFRDETGSIVIFSSMVPDGTVLHVSCELGFAPVRCVETIWFSVSVRSFALISVVLLATADATSAFRYKRRRPRCDSEHHHKRR